MRPRLTAALLLACAVSGPAQDPAGGTLLVLNKSDATLWLLDPATGARRAEVPTGPGPHELAVTADGATAVVADYGDQQPGHTLTLVDLAAARVARTLDLAPHQRPHGLALLPDGRLAVTSETSGALLLVDLQAGRVVAELPTGQAVSHMVAVTPGGARAFVANIGSGNLSAFDLAEGRLLGVVPAGAGTEGVDVTPDGRLVLASNREADTLSLVDPATLEELAELPTARFPIRVKATPDGRRALVSCALAGVLQVIDLEARGELARIELGGEVAPDAAQRLIPEQGPVPVGVLVEPSGRLAFVACSNADAVVVVDLERLAVQGRFATGRQPDGLGWTPLAVPAPAGG